MRVAGPVDGRKPRVNNSKADQLAAAMKIVARYNNGSIKTYETAFEMVRQQVGSTKAAILLG